MRDAKSASGLFTKEFHLVIGLALRRAVPIARKKNMLKKHVSFPVFGKIFATKPQPQP
jgi:hypothetical protein